MATPDVTKAQEEGGANEAQSLYHDIQPMTEVEAALGVTYVDMDALLAESDFVTLHINLTKATYHLIGQEALGKMKPTAVLINAARGGVVDSEALYKALRDGEIAYAALDVTEPEPIPDDAPSPITLLTR